MYRLLSLRKIKIYQLNGVSCSGMGSASGVLERTCMLCKQTSNVSARFTRYQSTHTNPHMKPPRKKRTRGMKKYAEILMVRENSTMEQKATVKKLSSRDLNFFTSTNLNLNEFYKLKDMMRINRTFVEHTYNDLAVIEDIPVSVEATINYAIEIPNQSVIMPRINNVIDAPIVSDSIKEDTGIEKAIENDPECSDLLSIGKIAKFTPTNSLAEFDLFQKIIPARNTFQPEVVEDDPAESGENEDFKDVKAKNEQQNTKKQFLLRQEVISRTLSAYIEMCGLAKMPHKGFNALYNIRYNSFCTQHGLQVNQIDPYNAAFKTAASQGDFNKIQEIFEYAKSIGVNFNVQSYVSIFECLGRCNVQDNHLKQIRIYVKEARQSGFTFDMIMNEGNFMNDERELVIGVMQAYDKEYIPTYLPPNVQYDNSLLNRLNNEEQLRYDNKKDGKENKGIFTQATMRDMIQEQMKIEKIGYITIKNIENIGEPSEEVKKYRQAVDEHTQRWEGVAFQAFNRDLVALESTKQGSRMEPFMKSIPLKDFIEIIVEEAKLIAQGSETYSPTANQLYRDLGAKVYSRFKVLRKKKTAVLDKILSIHSKYCRDYVSLHHKLHTMPTHSENLNTRQIWQWLEYNQKSNGSSIELVHQPWVPTVLQGIGKFLYKIIMHDLTIDVSAMRGNSKKSYVPAFYTIFRHSGRIIKEEVKPHPILSKLYRASAAETLKFPTYLVPMKCPPVPWSNLNIGGYLLTPTEFVRLPSQAVTQKQRLQEVPPQQLYPSFDALNQLGAVPWKVNKRILDYIMQVFLSGGSSKLSVPAHPSTVPHPVAPSTEMDKQQKYLFIRQKLQHRRKKAEMYSLWCDCLYRLSLANHFRENIFWLPHNMDFRGRVYPVPPHLNHLGSDLARSILVFAEGRPLGVNGLNWLKLHLVNLTGLKKRDSVEERLEFANEIMDKILDSADNPLDGQMWWASSDEPWQTLACCMEIAAAVRSPNPKKYICYFPVHQDGSCNGLQHYAALGRDSAGGYSVNLTPASKPQDVYSAVAVLVEERRHQDAQKGIEIARVLEGYVRRKVIKQTVMTTVYGVTRYGAKLQIARQLKDIEDFPKDYVWAASHYLTARTFESLRTMFTSTREIQDWFTECARQISSVCGANVEWVTPLGLPVVQPYFRYKSINSTNFYEPFHMDKYEKPNVMKQKNAFPPNFIHSLDSSHMMLTSLHSERAGITFVSVHDCYWTHPSTVNIMNKICREQFVALHAEPILENLSTFLTQKYSYNFKDFSCDGSAADLAKRRLNRVLNRLPTTGDLNIEQVLDSIYFFS